MIAALWATINGCSASVTDRGGWCVAAPSNANRLAPLATTVNDQNRKNEPQQACEAHVSGNDRRHASVSRGRQMDRSMRRAFRMARACDGHHVIARGSSARRHRQGPKAARTRGRSEATSLARCRAQIQHRERDGGRIRKRAARRSDACPKACDDRVHRGRRISRVIARGTSATS